MRQESCEDCRSWEEELFWTHFQYIHFSQFLHAGFDQRLAIPEKFTRNLRRKLPDMVTLKSPGGTEWKVGLTAHENTLFLSHGWREFVEQHSLEVNDMLVFKYNGESCFDVLMFDGQSMCEKSGSYFLTKCVHKCQTERKSGGCSAEVPGASPGNGNGGCQQKKYAHNNVHTTSLAGPFISQVGNKKAQREIMFSKVARKIEPRAEDLKAKADIAYTSPGLSSKRSIRKEELRKVLQSATAAVTPEGFISVMKPTHISKRYFMTLPTAWVSKHIASQENQYVILRIQEKTWKTRFYYRKSPIRGGFCGGWKSFVLDNNIQEFDVCVFEPGILSNNTVVLDVNIFHVSEATSLPAPASA